MLYTSWRNEQTDLLGTFSSYQERYRTLSKVMSEQMKQYAVCNEDLDEIEQDINRVEETYASIAPCTENMEQQDHSTVL